MKYLHLVSMLLIWVGALNWGLIGLMNFNLVESLGLPSGVVQLVYILVGIAAVYAIATHSGDCKTCMAMMKGKK